MERMTEKLGGGGYALPAGSVEEADGFLSGPAVDRLGAFEDAVGLVEEQLARTSAKLDELKARGRIRTAQGQQLLAQKLTYASVLSLMGVREDA